MIEKVLTTVIRGVISGVIGGGGGGGPFPTVNALYYPEPIGGSDATMRYQWNMDAQDDFLLRGEPYVCSSDTEISIVFLPRSIASLQRLANFDVNANIDMVSGSGFIRFTGFGGGVVGTLNGTVIASNTTQPIQGEYNLLSVRGNVAGDTLTVLGTQADALSNFFDGVISAVAFIDYITPANSFVTTFSGNGATENAIGLELPSGADFTRENGEPSGSDMELITREEDNSGWSGDALYPYADGALP